jgi:hypothetical protein
MRWFNDRSTLAKLLGTLAAVCLVMAAVGYTGITTAQRIKTNLDDVAGNLLPSTSNLATTQYNLARAQRDIHTAILLTDKQQVADAITLMKGEIAAGAKSWTAYNELSAAAGHRTPDRNSALPQGRAA